MQNNYTTKSKHLTIHSRRLIERWKNEGKSNREIASLLGKAPQTIHNEIKRGTVLQCIGKERFKKIYDKFFLFFEKFFFFFEKFFCFIIF